MKQKWGGGFPGMKKKKKNKNKGQISDTVTSKGPQLFDTEGRKEQMKQMRDKNRQKRKQQELEQEQRQIHHDTQLKEFERKYKDENKERRGRGKIDKYLSTERRDEATEFGRGMYPKIMI